MQQQENNPRLIKLPPSGLFTSTTQELNCSIKMVFYRPASDIVRGGYKVITGIYCSKFYFLLNYILFIFYFVMPGLQWHMCHINIVFTYVSLEHKSSHKQHWYICSNSQQYIAWVKMIDFSLMPKIIRILRSCSMKIFRTVNISQLNFLLVICIATNFIWTTLKMIFSIFRFFFAPSDSRFSAKYCPIITNHTSMESCINLLRLVLCSRVTYTVYNAYIARQYNIT